MEWLPMLEWLVGGVVLFYQGLIASISMAMVLMLAWHAVMMFGHTFAHWSPRRRITSTVTRRLPLFWRRTHLHSVRALEAMGYRELGVRDARFAWSHHYERLFLCEETGSYAGLCGLFPSVRFFSELTDGTVVLSTQHGAMNWRGGPAMFVQWSTGSLLSRHTAHVDFVQLHPGCRSSPPTGDLNRAVVLAQQIDHLQAGVKPPPTPVNLDVVPSSIGIRQDVHELAIALRGRPMDARQRWWAGSLGALWVLGLALAMGAGYFLPEWHWVNTGWWPALAILVAMVAIPLLREMYTVTLTLTQDHLHVKYRRHSRWIPMAQLRAVHVEGAQLWLTKSTAISD